MEPQELDLEKLRAFVKHVFDFLSGAVVHACQGACGKTNKTGRGRRQWPISFDLRQLGKRIGQRRLRPAPAVAGRSRIGAGALRPDMKSTGRIAPGDRTAARSDPRRPSGRRAPNPGRRSARAAARPSSPSSW